MPGPIFEELAAGWHKAEHSIADIIRHNPDPATISTSTVPEENPAMPSLAQLEQDARNEIQVLTDKAGEIWNHGKTVLEQHLPAIEAEAQRIQGSPVVQALEAALLTPAEEAMVAKLIADLPSLRITTQPQSPETPSEPSEPAAQPVTPDAPPQTVSVGPVVGGTAT